MNERKVQECLAYLRKFMEAKSNAARLSGDLQRLEADYIEKSTLLKNRIREYNQTFARELRNAQAYTEEEYKEACQILDGEK